ncbi:GPI inositol-deacylase [Cordyceps fumosorosea ARSEF 2679]|uniref:GPI inositol-deacylase n=1 Tax=Cordyceps fumosorosea (strain ARSEF 2679) TaxID=1081104 RepID=A0A168AQN0_CORFA|nr:GPI inositol-deacylase [Cordyceps fumosorosea ARSEF 2679]OAA69063.1 GPI inositol-deacylase [Cordyceps fumosorosea ARSEF 2679]
MTRRSSGSTDDGDESSPIDPDVLAGEADNRPSGLKSRPLSTRAARRPSNLDWNHAVSSNGNGHTSAKPVTPSSPPLSQSSPTLPATSSGMGHPARHRSHARRFGVGTWSISIFALVTAALGLFLLGGILHSLMMGTSQQDAKGCRMSYMRPSYIHYREFDTEHTRFATKYSLHLYREQGLDDEVKLRGVPVLFIPGNAGSYKQVRPIAAEAASYFYERLQHDGSSLNAGIRNLDFFTVDFNEDITAFHGQTLLDQAEYLNEAIRYILSLYSDPSKVLRDPDLPDPTSVIIIGHSMGGVVARAMLVQSNYQANSINTIITMSAPHARPPVTFDGQIVQIYDEINEYWRRAYTQKWASSNPLWHVTLISIAGGSLDTVVPSDYADIDSLVPETHGFTVYTTGVPTVWTSADHQAIMWCDQFRKVVSQALFDVVDVHRASQTKPRADRMTTFRKRFLSGLEPNAQRTISNGHATTLLMIDENMKHLVPTDQRLVLRQLGTESPPRVHLLPVPPAADPVSKRFSLISNSPLSDVAGSSPLEVLFCTVLTSPAASIPFVATMDFTQSTKVGMKLSCKNAAGDVAVLPASTRHTANPFYRDGEPELVPFSHLRYDAQHFSEYHFVAIIDQADSPLDNFVIAEFRDALDFDQEHNIALGKLLTLGLSFTLPATRPTVVEAKIPAIESSLLAYRLQVDRGACEQNGALFAPMLRQSLQSPYESRYFVNISQAGISLHGVAPYMPPTMAHRATKGVGLEFFSDPTCKAPIKVTVTFDALGSLGKLYMRYRTVFAAFPLLIVTLVLRKQFRVYDETGVFISFSESLDLSLRQSIPLLLLSLTLLATSIGVAPQIDTSRRGCSLLDTISAIDFHRNDLLIGTDDPFFTFMVPLIGIVCIGVCTALHYIILLLTQLFSFVFILFRPRGSTDAANGSAGVASPIFAPSTPRRRMISTAILLLLVSTFIPYQFAYLVACLVQLFTSVRARRIGTVTPSTSNVNYYHYTHSILLLMMWVLPINLPILAVWVRNLAVHWLTPFSSHHNVVSITPFILLVENMTTGRMVPQISSWLRHVTSILLFATALCAAIYGVSHAYLLHYLVNIIAAWLVILHATSTSWASIGAMFEGNADKNKECEIAYLRRAPICILLPSLHLSAAATIIAATGIATATIIAIVTAIDSLIFTCVSRFRKTSGMY